MSARTTALGTRGVRRAMLLAVVLLIIGIGGWAIVANGNRRGGETRAASGPATMAGMSTSANGSVTLTAGQIRQFGVTFGTVDVRVLTAEMRTTGVVAFDETRMAQVAARVGGFAERLYVNATGQPVRRGQPLLEIYSPDLVAAQQELLLARQLQRDVGQGAVPGVPGNSTDLVAASRRRLQLLNVSDGQVDEILRSGRVRRTLTLFAPVSGVVLEKMVLQGQAVMAGQQLYTIADLGDVWIDVQLREADVASVRTGTGADIEVAGLTGRVLKGRVTYIYPTLDSTSRSVRARVVISNSSGLLKPGMYAIVRLSTPSRSALAVPASAVLRTGERNIVFVAQPNGELRPLEVEVGRTAGEYTEILAGLAAGQRVVTSAQFLLDSESNLGELMKSMAGQAGAGDEGTAGAMKDMPGMEMQGAKAPAASTPRR